MQTLFGHQGISLSQASRETTALLNERGVGSGAGRKLIRSWCRRNGVELFSVGAPGYPVLVPADVPARIAAIFDEDIAEARRRFAAAHPA